MRKEEQGETRELRQLMCLGRGLRAALVGLGMVGGGFGAIYEVSWLVWASIAFAAEELYEVSMALVLITYMALMLKRENRELRQSMLTIPVLAVLVLTTSYFASPLFQERVDVTRAFATGSASSAVIGSENMMCATIPSS